MSVQILVLTACICIEKHHCLLTILHGSLTESSSLGFVGPGSSPGDSERRMQKKLVITYLSVFRHIQQNV